MDSVTIDDFKIIHVFLDLEGVLIESWDDWWIQYQNKDLISKFANKVNGEIRMFSNAIDNRKEAKFFEDNMIVLEKEFGLTIEKPVSNCLSRMEIMGFEEELWKYKRMGKRNCFLEHVKAISAKEGELYVLLDDEVQNDLVHFDGYSIMFVRVGR